MAKAHVFENLKQILPGRKPTKNLRKFACRSRSRAGHATQYTIKVPKDVDATYNKRSKMARATPYTNPSVHLQYSRLPYSLRGTHVTSLGGPLRRGLCRLSWISGDGILGQTFEDFCGYATDGAQYIFEISSKICRKSACSGRK